MSGGEIKINAKKISGGIAIGENAVALGERSKFKSEAKTETVAPNIAAATPATPAARSVFRSLKAIFEGTIGSLLANFIHPSG